MSTINIALKINTHAGLALINIFIKQAMPIPIIVTPNKPNQAKVRIRKSLIHTFHDPINETVSDLTPRRISKSLIDFCFFNVIGLHLEC